MSDLTVEQDILRLLGEYKRCKVMSVTADTVASTLRLSRAVTLKALQELMVQGRVEYAQKNGMSAQARFQLAFGGRHK